jgi:hypothetical protein
MPIMVRLILGLVASVSLAVAWTPDTRWPFAAARAASHSSLPSGALRYALHVTLAPADQADIRDGVVGSPKRACRDERSAVTA